MYWMYILAQDQNGLVRSKHKDCVFVIPGVSWFVRCLLTVSLESPNYQVPPDHGCCYSNLLWLWMKDKQLFYFLGVWAGLCGRSMRTHRILLQTTSVEGGSYHQAGRCQKYSLKPRRWRSRLYVFRSRVLLGVPTPSCSMQVIGGSTIHLQCHNFDIYLFTFWQATLCRTPVGYPSQCGAAGSPGMGGFL